MSSLDDHCIITKFELTEKEKQMKKAFFKNNSNKDNKFGKKEENKKSTVEKSEKEITDNRKGFIHSNDDLVNRLIKENLDPILNQNLKYLSNSGKNENNSIPLNIVYSQNKILERNVDILQETQRSLKDFFIYNLQNNNQKNTYKTNNNNKPENIENKKFLIELVKPLYQGMENLKSSFNTVLNQKKENISKENLQENVNELVSMQKNLKINSNKLEKSINFVEQNNQIKKDNELYKVIDEIKSSIINVHKEMNKMEGDITDNFKKMFEETSKKNLMQMFNNKSNKDTGNNFNFNKNSEILKNFKDEDIIDYAEFKKSLYDINMKTEELKNEYEMGKSKINLVHKFERSEKIDFSYNIDFNDPFSFNSFEESYEKNNNSKPKVIKNSPNIFKKNLSNPKILKKNIDSENFDSTDKALFDKNKKQKNIFLNNLNKTIDSNEKNINLNKENSAEKKNENYSKVNPNQSTNYSVNSPSVNLNLSKKNLSNTVNNSNIKSKDSIEKNKNNLISVINEEKIENENPSVKNKYDEIFEKAKIEIIKNQNENSQQPKKGLKDLLFDKINLKGNNKQNILKDIVTKILIERIITDKNKNTSKFNKLNDMPNSNEEVNFYLREKDYYSKIGSGKFFDLDISDKSAREITEKVLLDKIRILLNKKKIKNLLTGSIINYNKSSQIQKEDEVNLKEEKDILVSLENKLFDKLNKENNKRDNLLNDNFSNIINRLLQMENTIGKSKNIPMMSVDNENNKLSDSKIEINNDNNYDDIVNKITEKIKSNMHITINLNDNKDNKENKIIKKINNLEFNSESMNILSEQNKQGEKLSGYTHPFLNKKNLTQMLFSTEDIKVNLPNIPLPHTINFNDYEISSSSYLTESKRTIAEPQNNLEENTYVDQNFYNSNPNLYYFSNINNKINNFASNMDRNVNNSSNKISTFNNIKKNYLNDNENYNQSNLNLQKLNSINIMNTYKSKEESYSEGQIITMSNLINESGLDNVYAYSIDNHNNLNDDLEEKILKNKEKIKQNEQDISEINESEKNNFANNYNNEDNSISQENSYQNGINFKELRNINKDLEETLEKYGNNKTNLNNDEEINENSVINKIGDSNKKENYNVNSNTEMEEKIKFLKSKNVYDSAEQMLFQKTFPNILSKNNERNFSNSISQSSNNQNIPNSFSSNVNISNSVSSSQNKIFNNKNNFLGKGNNNQVYLSFGGNLINHNSQGNKNYNNRNMISQNSNASYNDNNIYSNVSSNINSGRAISESLININNSNTSNYQNEQENAGNNNKYYGYNNTISENYTYTESVDSVKEKNLNNKFYKTDESSEI